MGYRMIARVSSKSQAIWVTQVIILTWVSFSDSSIYKLVSFERNIWGSTSQIWLKYENLLHLSILETLVIAPYKWSKII